MIDQDGMQQEERTEHCRQGRLGQGQIQYLVTEKGCGRGSSWRVCGVIGLCQQHGKRHWSTLKTAALAQIEIVI